MEITERDLGDHLARHGAKLIEQGYAVIPIQPGKKAPGFEGWQKSKSTTGQVREWLENGFAHAGVGILTKFTCAVDIDCLDEATAKKFEQWCIDNIGPAPIRIGKPPKRLLLYRTSEPFRKQRSAVYEDEWGEKQLVEVLGDGQQFVAFHIHPDTKKPYTWVDDRSPLNVRASELTEISIEQIEQLLEAFEDHAKAMSDWKPVKPARTAASAAAAAVDTENPFLEDSAPVQISDDELRQRLLLVPGAEDYDLWVQVGMALYHQFDGETTGFDLWNEWSETADNYDPDALERHWKSFNVQGKKRAPLTARFVLRLANEAVQKMALETSVKLRDAFVKATTMAEWTKAKDQAREAKIDGLSRSALAVVAKERLDAITGSKTSLIEVKKAIAYQPKKTSQAPKWVEGWVYDTSDDRFFNMDRKIAVTKQGFDALYDRYSLTEKDVLDGRTAPSQSASDLALNLWKIPVVDGRRYVPGRDAIFHEPDGTFANTYPEHEIPEKPEKILPRDKKNIDRIKRHIAHLLPDEREQRLLLDWLSWVVQNPGKHANFAVLLQGVEGDGKSFFAMMMRAVMGVSNVKMLNADTIVNSTFNGWAVGQCLCAVEEVRIVGAKGQDKWATVNRIKPLITNPVIEVHAKNVNPYNAINTTNYLMFSNHKDAIPLNDDSRRYLILFSQWQHKTAIDAFKQANPLYYTRLYQAIDESPGAIRQWLLEHEQDENFNPMGDAPETRARKVMIFKSKPEYIQELDKLIEEDSVPGVSAELVDITEANDVLFGRGITHPGPKAISSMLERDGYELLGRLRVGDEVHSLYSKCPDKFQSTDGSGVLRFDTKKARDHLRARRLVTDSDL